MTEEINYRPTPSQLIVGPVKIGYTTDVRDANGDAICDIRGWGRLQYYKNGDKLQDKIAQYIVDAINEKLAKDPI